MPEQSTIERAPREARAGEFVREQIHLRSTAAAKAARTRRKGAV